MNSLLEMERHKWEAEKNEIEDEVSSEKRITQSVQEEKDHHVWAVVNFFMSKIWKTDPKFEASYLEPFVVKKDIFTDLNKEVLPSTNPHI